MEKESIAFGAWISGRRKNKFHEKTHKNQSVKNTIDFCVFFIYTISVKREK